MTTTRRLAAILAADVAGYSRLIGADEGGTLERLKALRRELIDPKIAEEHGGVFAADGHQLFERVGARSAVRRGAEPFGSRPRGRLSRCL